MITQERKIYWFYTFFNNFNSFGSVSKIVVKRNNR